MIERWASEALAASRSTRTSRTPMVAASGSSRFVDLLGVEAGRQAEPQSATGRDGLGGLDSRELAMATDDLTGHEDPVEPAPGGAVPQSPAQPGRSAGRRHTPMPRPPNTRTASPSPPSRR